MYDIYAVANWFLNHSSMDQKKLQKLCYYAQAWNLALNGSRMIDGDFEAWVHGPVNRSLWNRLKEYGYISVESGKFSSSEEIKDPCSISVLNDVWATYGEYTGYQLELLTHKEKPWLEARSGYLESAPSSVKINPVTMREYYSGLISKDGVSE